MRIVTEQSFRTLTSVKNSGQKVTAGCDLRLAVGLRHLIGHAKVSFQDKVVNLRLSAGNSSVRQKASSVEKETLQTVQCLDVILDSQGQMLTTFVEMRVNASGLGESASRSTRQRLADIIRF